ncbi:tetratricopeptide repeat protein [Hydrogenophaga sp.]|uniref:tetratricopeptide repeat protein n=1 Tax=Hydrogenophaga sp. TaxID=1904254 RepID=UPI0035AFF14B
MTDTTSMTTPEPAWTALSAPEPAPARWTPVRLALAAVVLAGAGWLAWLAWDVNITLSCWKNEWPNLAVCEEINGRTPEERVARLKERLASNPGDNQALVALAVYASTPGLTTEEERLDLLARAIKAAPQHRDVLRLRVGEDLRQARWAQALEPLRRLSQYHQDKDASAALAELATVASADPALQARWQDLLQQDTAWLGGVLRALPGINKTMGEAMPVVLMALQAPAGLEPRTGQFVIGQLKKEERWIEAHAVWMHLWKRPLPLLFNGDFEQAFVAQGFDWETPGSSNDHRAGAQVDRIGRKDRGQVLRVGFNGKQVRMPVVRQHLLLPPGRYRFSGQWQSNNLQTAKGLAWVLRCAGNQPEQQTEFARVPGIVAKGRDWQDWRVDIEAPASCNLGVELALVTDAAYEARAGLRGEVFFDKLAIQPEGAQP